MTRSTRFLTLALAVLWCGGAAAQSRPDATRMTCAAAAGAVRSAGAIVLNTGPQLYDRYVASQRFCALDEIMLPRWAPTIDNPQCFIGYVCQRESWGAGPQ
jgi:hypothetical protein